MRKSRFSEEQISAVLKESEGGVETGELCWRHGIRRACFYKWKSKFGGAVLVMQVEVALSQRRACGLMELYRARSVSKAEV